VERSGQVPTVNAAAVAPTITTQPVNQTVTAGQTASFAWCGRNRAAELSMAKELGKHRRGDGQRATRRRDDKPADSGSTFRAVATNTADG